VRLQPRCSDAAIPWVLDKFTEDPFEEALLTGLWPAEDFGAGDVGTCAERLRDLLIRFCDAAMPRSNPRPRRAAHWWSDEIAPSRSHKEQSAEASPVTPRARSRGSRDGSEGIPGNIQSLLKGDRRGKGQGLGRAPPHIGGKSVGAPVSNSTGKVKEMGVPAYGGNGGLGPRSSFENPLPDIYGREGKVPPNRGGVERGPGDLRGGAPRRGISNGDAGEKYGSRSEWRPWESLGLGHAAYRRRNEASLYEVPQRRRLPPQYGGEPNWSSSARRTSQRIPLRAIDRYVC